MFKNGTETEVSELNLNMNLAAGSVIKVLKNLAVILYCIVTDY